MTIDRAKSYLAKIPLAAAGQRNDSLNRAAYSILQRFDLSEPEFESLLLDYAAACAPPLGQDEALKTIRSAWIAAHRNGSVGSKAKTFTVTAAPPIVVKVPATKYDLSSCTDELPEPIPDGARVLLRHCFRQGEGVRIAAAQLNDDNREIPASAGNTFSREEWLRKLDQVNGNPNGIFCSSKKTGIYVTINPMRLGGGKDSDVTDYRHALLEFDEGISPAEQFLLYQRSQLPCAAVIFSGGKSVHAWVKVDAKDRREYDDRVRILYDHFAAYRIDAANRNPSRFSRLPNCVRFDRHQELLALDIGLESFSEWLAHVQAAGIGKTSTFNDLFNYDSAKDGQSIIGHRWLCRGGSCLLIGPSGIGKSSIVIQLAVSWAIGRSAFGLQPTKPLRVLIVQAENDDGDMHEILSGVCAGLEINTNKSILDLAQDRLIFVRDMTHVGDEFIGALRRLVDRHKPDLVVIDPLLSFIGADISRQEVCSHFLRSGLNPIGEATGVAWLAVHHTGKPATDPKAKSHWRMHDYSYSGIGSSELTNWTRAIMVLEQSKPGFRLMFTKRGKRACATHPNGTVTDCVLLDQAEHSIHWLQRPPEPASDKPAGRPKAEWDLKAFLESIQGEEISRAEIRSRACAFGKFSRSHFESVVWKILKFELTPKGRLWVTKLP